MDNVKGPSELTNLMFYALNQAIKCIAAKPKHATALELENFNKMHQLCQKMTNDKLDVKLVSREY